MKARIANKIVRAIGFHEFKWAWPKSGKRERLEGEAWRTHRWSFETIVRAWNARTIYYPTKPKVSKIRLTEIGPPARNRCLTKDEILAMFRGTSDVLGNFAIDVKAATVSIGKLMAKMKEGIFHVQQ